MSKSRKRSLEQSGFYNLGHGRPKRGYKQLHKSIRRDKRRSKKRHRKKGFFEF